MIEIVPTLLEESYDEFVSLLGRLRGARPLTGSSLMVQIDVCDGLFVKNRSWPFNPSDRAHFADIIKGDEGLPYWEDFNYEVDLMVQYPERHLSNWIAAGISRAVIHLESKHDWALIKEAAGDTVELGVAIDLDPPLEKLQAAVAQVNYIQIMGVAQLGRQGGELSEKTAPLVARVRSEFPDVTIQIDGGVNADNARLLIDAGADRLVVGSHIVKASDPKERLEDLQNL